MGCYYSLHNLRAQGLLFGYAAARTHFANRSLFAVVVTVARNHAGETAVQDSQYSAVGSQ